MPSIQITGPITVAGVKLMRPLPPDDEGRYWFRNAMSGRPHATSNEAVAAAIEALYDELFHPGTLSRPQWDRLREYVRKHDHAAFMALID